MAWFGKKKKPPPPKKGGAGSKTAGGALDPLDQQIVELMEQLNIPRSGRDKILLLPKDQKTMMLESYKQKLSATAKKKQASGKEWSDKFNSTSVTWKLLKEFEVVLKDSDVKFANEFIAELGLKRLCRVSRANINTQFDTQILLIFKAIIDTSQNIIKDLISDDQTVTTIVSKVDADDSRVRELAIKLLVTLVIVEDDDVSILASSKIMASLLDSARQKGYRNRWKTVVSHLSVNELSGGGSYEYDNYALILINFVISALETVEERTDERRLLNSLKFNDSLQKLKKSIDDTLSKIETRSNTSSDDTPSSPVPIQAGSGASLKGRGRRQSHVALQLVQYQYCQSVQAQTTAYNHLREEDITELKESGIIDDENDLSSPMGLFKLCHDQALDDGYINELTSILKNLITIPASGDLLWSNITKIVQSACKPVQSKYNIGGAKNVNSNDENNKNTYLTYKELQHLLKVQATEEEKEREIKSKSNETEQKLNEERKKVTELENQVKGLQETITTLKASGGGGGGGGLPPPPGSGGGLPPPPTAAPIPGSAPVDDGLDKFRKMVKMGIPKNAVVNKMKQSGVDIKIIQKYELTGKLPDAPTGGGGGGGLPAPAPVPAADDGLEKFRKMVKMGIPKNAVMNKMKQAGIANNIIQKYELTGQIGSGGGAAAPAPAPAPTPGGGGLPPPAPTPAGPVLTKEEELKLAKYLKMKKMNLPEQVIRNKMKQDGIDSALADKMFGGGGGGGVALPKPKPKPKWPENLKRKPEIKPSRKMKNLQWKAVDPFTVEKSIWKECDDTKIKFDEKELEGLFGQKIIETKTKKGGGGGKGGSSKKKKETVEKISILDGKRSYNVEIFLGRLRMDPYSAKDIILKMDENKFNAEQVSKLVNFVPTPEESAMFEGLDKNDEKNLARPEKFFNVIRNIDKNLPQRLELWAFKMNFDKILAVESDKVYALKDAHQCIKNSKSLRELFSIILAFGNYMNGGTKKGQAHGFRLNSLSQLTRSRSTNNKMTLMEYLYEYLLKNKPNLLNFVDEWKALEIAISVDIPTLRGSISQINGKLNIISNRLKIAEQTTMAGDKFPSVMKPFHSEASSKFNKVKKDHETVTKNLYELALFLNEKNDRTGVFLKTLNEFRKQFIFTMKQVKERKKREEERAKHAKWKAQRKGHNKSSNSKTKIKSINETKNMDDQKDDNNTTHKGGLPRPPPPPGSAKKKNATLLGGNQNKSDQMLAALMRSDSSALMSKLKARRKKNSTGGPK